MKGIFLVLTIWISGAENFRLLLLHNNDIHARFEETSRNSEECKPEDKNRNCYGGFARMANVIRSAREEAKNGEGPNVLFFNGGDTYTGTPWFTLHKWKIAQDFLNRVQPDAMCLGNHELIYGIEDLVPFVEHYEFPIVAANLNFSKVPMLNKKITPSVIIDLAGHKIGVIGYLTTDTKTVLTNEEVGFYDEVESVKRESARLDSKGVKIIIALGHAGIKVDKKIAKECPLVDVVIGGHTNTFLWNGQPPDVEVPEGPYPIEVVQASGKKVPVVQAYAYTKYLGRLYVTFDADGNLIESIGKPLLLNNEIPQDKDILDLLNIYRKDLDTLMEQPIGISSVDLEIDECNVAECSFGNLIVDAFIGIKMSNYTGKYWTDTPIAVYTSFCIRTHLGKGKLTKFNFMTALPFDQQVYSFDLNGTHVLEMLENSVRSHGDRRSEFLQVSGIRVTYDLSKPIGKRVVNVYIRCGACNVPKYEPLDINKTYRILSNGYNLNGYEVLRNNSFNKQLEVLNDANTVIAYVEKQKLIYTEISGRIQFIERSSSNRNICMFGIILTIIITLLKLN